MTSVGSMCTGYGGLDAAMAVLGGELAWVCDLDPAATALLAHHYPQVPNHHDLTATDWTRVERVDVVTAGWPCQPWSQAGKRKGAADERAIWPAVAGAIRNLRPGLVVLENVSAILGAGELSRAVGDLAAFGYDACWTSLRASDVGAPHKRERVFIAAIRVDSATGAIDSRFGMDGWPVRRRGVHHAKARLEAAPDPAGHVDDRRGRDSALRVASELWWGTGSLCPEGSRHEADIPLDDHHGFRVGDGPESDLGWTVFSPPCESHRGDDGSPRGADGADSADIVASDSSDVGHQRPRSAWGRGTRSADSGDAPADSTGNRWGEGRPEPAGKLGGPDAALSGLQPVTVTGRRNSSQPGPDRQTAPHSSSPRLRDAQNRGSGEGHEGAGTWGPELERGGGEPAIDWAGYRPAIERWERTLGRRAPAPTLLGKRGGRQLAPAFVEWLMGLPDGWVTGVPGLTRNQQLKLLGNGVVPQQAEAAIRYLLPILTDCGVAA